MKKFFIAILTFAALDLNAADVPIIFVHGNKGEGNRDAGWRTWYPTKDGGLEYQTAMTRIISAHYGNYSAGEPLNCHMNTNLQSTGAESRKIYNFGRYFNDALRETGNTDGPKRNIEEVIAIEWLGGAAFSSASWYLAKKLMEARFETDLAGVAIIGLGELILGAPVSASIGVTIVGEKFGQKGSFWRCFLVSFIGTWLSYAIANPNSFVSFKA